MSQAVEKKTGSLKRSDRILFIAMAVSYALFVITTFMQDAFLITVFSPVTAILTGTVIMNAVKRMGAFGRPAFLMGMGIYMWALADILTFLNTWFLHIDRIDDLIAMIFLLPNYFYGIAVAVYFLKKLKGRELYQFLMNSLTLTIIGSIAFKKLLDHVDAVNRLGNLDLLRIGLYFFINLFIVILLGHIVYMIAVEKGINGTLLIFAGIFTYILLDIPYTYQQAVGNDPENIYQNLLYMLCMMLMAGGILHQLRYEHYFKLKMYAYTEKIVRRIRLIVVLGIIAGLTLWMMHIVTQNEFFYLLIAILAYWIMTSTFRNSALSEQLLKQQDLLTGLYNRRYIQHVMEEAVTETEGFKNRFAVYCIDLNSFKPINDTYGHDMGDQVLKEFGKRMLMLESDYISFRTGGDEFMVIRKGITEDGQITETARRLQSLFNRPVSIDTYLFRLSGSIGVAVYPTDSDNTDTLVRYADAAMYSVKHSGHKDGFRIFDRTLVETVETHKLLEEKLKNADPEKDFGLYYQPRLDAGTGELIGAEAFPRLKGEDNYPASMLLPIAEEVGLMKRLSDWILETAIRQLKEWNRDREKPIYISLNLSPLQLLDKDFVLDLKKIVHELEMDVSLIHLDISNSVIMGASDTAKETLVQLSAKGFTLALNDFGGDDINLLHILDCGFSVIHLSPSLIRRLDTEPNALTLIRSIIALTQTMGIDSTAVGVETQAQEKKLKELGIDSLQGFFYSRPHDAEEFKQFLKK